MKSSSPNWHRRLAISSSRSRETSGYRTLASSATSAGERHLTTDEALTLPCLLPVLLHDRPSRQVSQDLRALGQQECLCFFRRKTAGGDEPAQHHRRAAAASRLAMHVHNFALRSAPVDEGHALFDLRQIGRFIVNQWDVRLLDARQVIRLHRPAIFFAQIDDGFDSRSVSVSRNRILI